ncbi:hypothetical protein MPL1_07184 [Methylophaga lonarensis MPL]|uniref:Transmembrane protein n=1 Tax=Methylophaga lonarensis MPL TaxID=1286106 RepID=M7PGQ9_9GAMM|nr:hypothetical protein [Methylophaga lonarensis]EMR13085.1 hypothetical protein MPL1_07184 [Methylophaga lonarensis MPL]MCC5796617.1 hypothetical protein [Methylophaga sp.]
MASDNEKAVRPHEVLMFNLAVCHFLLPAILFGTKQLWLIFTIPVLCSLVFIGWIARQAGRTDHSSHLVKAHWQLTWTRSQFLILAYFVAVVIFLLGSFLIDRQPDEAMQFIQRSILGWFALLPLSVTIIVLLIFEASAMSQARKGIMPADMKL